jgi:hypothetical protein
MLCFIGEINSSVCDVFSTLRILNMFKMPCSLKGCGEGNNVFWLCMVERISKRNIVNSYKTRLISVSREIKASGTLKEIYIKISHEELDELKT